MDYSTHTLGETAATSAIETLDDCRAACLALTRQAGRTVHIFSRDLDPRLYDSEEFCAAARQLAISSRFSEIRVLVQDTDRAVKHGHRLVELSRTLTSSLHIRAVDGEFRNYNEAFLVADEVGFVHRTRADRFEGKVTFYNPVAAHELLRHFVKVWEASSPDPQLLRLHI